MQVYDTHGKPVCKNLSTSKIEIAGNPTEFVVCIGNGAY